MSGGFFRGTSAEQDTRFSNKQAKLLKSQKFAPELEHLVDVTKVKMDVIKPWIAKRVTEFLEGFEDEVLINFIYELLEGKVVNGKQIQIQLTGFMEKNTGKFMKELWALLLSAQKNASGVPQQFLDAKEEETRKKKVETDRIFNEIQRRKEKEAKDSEQEKLMDDGHDNNFTEESDRRRERGTGVQSGDENGDDVRNGFRGRSRASKSPSDHSQSPKRKGSLSRSISGSPRGKRRSISPRRHHSPRRSGRESISPRWRSPRRRSLSRTRYRSPSPVRRRVRSPVHRRSPSPLGRRSFSPAKRSSPSPLRRGSGSPLRRRSPPRRRRSPSPWRRRSPSPGRRRSPSPVRRRRRRSTSSPRSRSPGQRRSPSPIRRRFQSPVRRSSYAVRRRSPSPVRRRSPSPVRRRSPPPARRRSPPPARRRSPSADRRSSPSLGRRRSPLPRGRRSPSPAGHRSLSPGRRRSPVPGRRRSPTASPSRSPSLAAQSSGSPVRHSSVSPVKMRSPRLQKSPHGSPRAVNRNQEPAMVARKQPISLSPQRDHSNRKHLNRKMSSVSPSPEKFPHPVSPQTRTRSSGEDRRLSSPNESLGKPQTRTRSSGEDRRLASPKESLGNRARDKMPLNGSRSPTRGRDHRVRNDTSDDRFGKDRENEDKFKLEERKSKNEDKYKLEEKKPVRSSGGKQRESPDRPASYRHLDNADARQEDNATLSEEASLREARALKKSPHKGSLSGEKSDILRSGDVSKLDDKRNSQQKDVRDNTMSDSLLNPHKKRRSPSVDSDSGSEESAKHRAEVSGKKKHRRSRRREVASDDSSSESEMEDRKEAKRRKKEERKLRKDERRKRREERRQRRVEKRASKRKRKSKDADALSSDVENNEKDANASNGELRSRKYSSDEDDKESQKKRLEIELRERALESLRAKKGISR